LEPLKLLSQHIVLLGQLLVLLADSHQLLRVLIGVVALAHQPLVRPVRCRIFVAQTARPLRQLLQRRTWFRLLLI